MATDTLARLAACGRKLKFSDAEIKELQDEARDFVARQMKMAAGQQDLPGGAAAAARATAADLSPDEIVAGAVKSRMRKMAARDANTYKQNQILEFARAYQGSVSDLGQYFLRLVDSSAGTANRTVTPVNSAAKQYNTNVSAYRDILDTHWGVLGGNMLDGNTGRRIAQWLRGEVGDTELTDVELNAARDVRGMLEEQRTQLAAAKGVPPELDDSALLAHYIRPSRLDENVDDFVEYMRGRVKDDDGYWTRNDGANLRELYTRRMGERDNALDNAIPDEVEDLRPLEFKNTDGYMDVMAKYTGADTLARILANASDMNARKSAVVSVFGTDIDGARARYVKIMTDARVDGNYVTAFTDSLDNLLGRKDMITINGKDRPSQLGLLSQTGAGMLNITRLGWSFLTSVMGLSRAFLHSTAMHGLVPAVVKMPLAMINQTAINRQGAEAALRSMRIVSQRQYAKQTNNIMQLGDAQDSLVGVRPAERIAGGAKMLSRMGTLTLSGFDYVNDFMRRTTVLSDNQALAGLLADGKGWSDLSNLQREFLTTGNISEADWLALKEAFDNGGRIDGDGGVFVDFDAIQDVRLANKWQGRSTKLADEVSGVVSQRSDAVLKFGSRPGFGRAAANAATGLMRDPLAGSFLLAETIATHWRAGGIHKLGAVGIIPAYAAMNMSIAHFKSQTVEFAKTGEFHDELDRNREQYLERLFYFYGLELFSGWMVSMPWIENDSAVIGGGPAFEDSVKTLRAVTKAVYDDDAELRKFFRGESDYNKVAADAFNRLAPLPGPVKTPIAARIREE